MAAVGLVQNQQPGALGRLPAQQAAEEGLQPVVTQYRGQATQEAGQGAAVTGAVRTVPAASAQDRRAPPSRQANRKRVA